jgi:hypothetical protein
MSIVGVISVLRRASTERPLFLQPAGAVMATPYPDPVIFTAAKNARTVSRSLTALHAIQKDVFAGSAPSATRTRSPTTA